MIKWIKGLEEYKGGPFKFTVGDEEYVSYSPTDDFLEEQGWTKINDEPENLSFNLEAKSSTNSIEFARTRILQECNNFYRDAILKVNFRNQIIWVPFETRQAYKVLLEDLKEAGETEVEFRDEIIDIDEALEILKALNRYEYKQKVTCNLHLRNLVHIQNTEELEEYDYTTGYDSCLSF